MMFAKIHSPRVAALLLVATLLSGPSLAVQPDEKLSDPVMEARARDIGRQLRCVVCQNESIDESHAALARDLRLLVRERLTAGDSDAQAIDYIHDRYGDFVLLRPPIRPETWALWFGPALLLLIGGVALGFMARRRIAPTDPTLSAADEQRLEALLRDQDKASDVGAGGNP